MNEHLHDIPANWPTFRCSFIMDATRAPCTKLATVKLSTPTMGFTGRITREYHGYYCEQHAHEAARLDRRDKPHLYDAN